MGNLITKVWFYFIIGVVLITSLFVSFFIFLAVLLVLLITVPFIIYLNWKAKKDFERYL